MAKRKTVPARPPLEFIECETCGKTYSVQLRDFGPDDFEYPGNMGVRQLAALEHDLTHKGSVEIKPSPLQCKLCRCVGLPTLHNKCERIGCPHNRFAT